LGEGLWPTEDVKFSGDFQDPARAIDLTLVKKKSFDMPPMTVSSSSSSSSGGDDGGGCRRKTTGFVIVLLQHTASELLAINIVHRNGQ